MKRLCQVCRTRPARPIYNAYSCMAPFCRLHGQYGYIENSQPYLTNIGLNKCLMIMTFEMMLDMVDLTNE